MIAFAHSLQGNSDTYNFAPTSDLPPALRIAFNSECTTKGYFVAFGAPLLSQGNSSSEQP